MTAQSVDHISLEEVSLPKGPITLAQWDALETEQRLELVEGMVVLMAPATSGHNRDAHRLGMWLEAALPPGRAVVVWENQVELVSAEPATVRQPDVLVVAASAYRRDRYRYSPAELLLVVEFVSPGSTWTDRTAKRQQYAQAGIERYWVFDIDARDPGQQALILKLDDDGVYQEQPGSFVDGRVVVAEPVPMDFTLADLTR